MADVLSRLLRSIPNDDAESWPLAGPLCSRVSLSIMVFLFSMGSDVVAGLFEDLDLVTIRVADEKKSRHRCPVDRQDLDIAWL
jgi:hypothetical protein